MYKSAVSYCPAASPNAAGNYLRRSVRADKNRIVGIVIGICRSRFFGRSYRVVNDKRFVFSVPVKIVTEALIEYRRDISALVNQIAVLKVSAASADREVEVL